MPLDTKTEPKPVAFVVTRMVPALNVVAPLFANAVATDLIVSPLFNFIYESVEEVLPCNKSADADALPLTIKLVAVALPRMGAKTFYWKGFGLLIFDHDFIHIGNDIALSLIHI